MRAIQITEYGGPEVLTLAELPEPTPSEGFDLVKVSSSGINYADTHQTENSYISATNLPLVPGSEVVGTLPDGRRIASLVGAGGYAEWALAPSFLSFALPDAVDDGQALALMVQGLTAWHLLRTSTHLAAGESVVVHAAAGGVGTLAIQLAKLWGAGRVIGVASSPEKRALAERLGADATVDGASEDLKAALHDANGGKPIDIVLEMTGGDAFDASLEALAPFGRIATYGMAGRVPPKAVEPRALMIGSRTIVGYWLSNCIGRPGMINEPMAEMLDLVAEGRLSPVVGTTYALADARNAHEDLRARKSTGKLVLDVTR
ncbi:MAG TPA: NADPH:quinone oxidoreductase family protein [Mycobacteriales bacterium]|nr:NADPH:quinone oxidoreductase family protein [Mycobacteriales bacterium]